MLDGNATVFISYSRQDLDKAVEVEEALCRRGVSVWRDQESIYAGQQWPKAIGEAVSSSCCVALLWSHSSAVSHFVEFEWTTAIALKKTCIPLLLDDAPLVPSLIAFNGIPLKDIDTAIERILDTITKTLTDPDSSRKSAVLTMLQDVAPSDSTSMARAASMMLTRRMQLGSTSRAADESGSPITSKQLEGLEISDRYRVIKMLGRGGMGAVYHVYDSELERDVALKVIHSDLAEEHVSIQRFKREIQLSSEVTHRNVLRVYDLGEGDGVKFLTMQYVEGEDLTDLLAREGKLPTERTVSILRQLVEGLAAAHEKNVVHRDLKPANILIDSNDHVFITDFGLATTFGMETEQAQLTQAGDIMGTPHYMSPEQVRGEPATAQSDIYSLGVILYEMVTGQLPFAGSTIYEILIQRTIKDPGPVKSISSGVPDFLDRIIQRCMARDSADRYASMGALLKDLDEEASPARPSNGKGPTQPRPHSDGDLQGTKRAASLIEGSVGEVPHSRRWPWLAALGITLSVAAVFALNFLLPTSPGTEPAPSEISFHQVTFSGHASRPAISPDGQYLVYSEEGGGTKSLVLRDLSGGSTLTLAKEIRELGSVEWAPGSQILYQPPENRNFQILNPETGEERPLIEDDSVGWTFLPAFSPDGTHVAFTWTRSPELSGIWAIDLDKKQEVMLKAEDENHSYFVAGWSPDGEQVFAYDQKLGELIAIPVGGGKSKTVYSAGMEVEEMTLGPGGRRVVVLSVQRNSDIWLAENFDPEATKSN